MKLKDNIERYRKDARKYFEEKEYLGKFERERYYQVATELDFYELEDVAYYPDDFEKTLKALIRKNPYSQLMDVFGEKLGLLDDIEKHLIEQDEDLLHIITLSDAGSVKIGNNDFSVLIPNGYGDGQTEVFITTKRVHVPLRFWTTVSGKFKIYDYDCGDDSRYTLDGDYSIFFGNGYVVFSKVG